MSLLITASHEDGFATLFCPACAKSIGFFTQQEVGELAIANIQPLCFDCDPPDESPPKHLYYRDSDVWLLGVEDMAFLGQWHYLDDDGCERWLSFTKISNATWYALKTGDIIYRLPLSS